MPAKRLWSWTALMRNSNPIREKRTASWLFDGFSSLGGGHVAWDTECQYVSDCRSETFCLQPPCRKSFNQSNPTHKKKIPRCASNVVVDMLIFNSRFSPYYFLPGIRLERMECLVAFRSLQAAGPYHPNEKKRKGQPTSFVPFEKKKNPKFFALSIFIVIRLFYFDRKRKKIPLRVQFKLECAFSIFQRH